MPSGPSSWRRKGQDSRTWSTPTADASWNGSLTAVRFLDWFDHGYNKEFIPMAEDPDGNIVPAEELYKTSPEIYRNTERMLVHQDLDRENEWLLISLMGGVDYHNGDFEETREWIKREHRSDLTQLMEEQEVAGA